MNRSSSEEYPEPIAVRKGRKVQRSQRKIDITVESVSYGNRARQNAISGRRTSMSTTLDRPPKKQHVRAVSDASSAYASVSRDSAVSTEWGSSSKVSLGQSLASLGTEYSSAGVADPSTLNGLKQSNVLTPPRSSISTRTQGPPSQPGSVPNHGNTFKHVISQVSKQKHRDRHIEQLKFQVCRSTMKRAFPRSPFFPGNFNSWVEHRQIILEEMLDRKKLDVLEKEVKTLKLDPTLNGKLFLDGRSAVLSLETIWSLWKPPLSRIEAPWPSPGEQKWEGDQRAMSGYARFPALPRVPAPNETIVWHYLKRVFPFDLDVVTQVLPWGKDVEKIGDEEGEILLGGSLWACL